MGRRVRYIFEFCWHQPFLSTGQVMLEFISFSARTCGPRTLPPLPQHLYENTIQQIEIRKIVESVSHHHFETPSFNISLKYTLKLGHVSCVWICWKFPLGQKQSFILESSQNPTESKVTAGKNTQVS